MRDFLPCDTLITSIGLIPECELAEEVCSEGMFPDWLFLCGNACYVHDSVDDVTYGKPERVGQLVAQFVINGTISQDNKNTSSKADRTSASGMVCLGCPKACSLIKTEDGFEDFYLWTKGSRNSVFVYNAWMFKCFLKVQFNTNLLK